MKAQPSREIKKNFVYLSTVINGRYFIKWLMISHTIDWRQTVATHTVTINQSMKVSEQTPPVVNIQLQASSSLVCDLNCLNKSTVSVLGLYKTSSTLQSEFSLDWTCVEPALILLICLFLFIGQVMFKHWRISYCTKRQKRFIFFFILFSSHFCCVHLTQRSSGLFEVFYKCFTAVVKAFLLIFLMETYVQRSL